LDPTAVAVGAASWDGVVRGVVVAEADGAPDPKAFTAETRNRYAVPLRRPETVADVDVEDPSANCVQFDTVDGRYSIT
jgi:hypothetical protein